MSKYTPKKIHLNLYGWTPNHSFGHAIQIPLVRLRRSELDFPKDIGSISFGRDDGWTIGLNLVNKRSRSSRKADK